MVSCDFPQEKIYSPMMFPIQITSFHITMWFIQGLLCSYFAHRRGRNPYLWFGVGAFLGLLGIIAFLFLTPKRKKKQATPPAAPHPMTFRQWYYLDAEHTQQGPLPYPALITKDLSPQTLVWNEDLTSWTPLSELSLQPPTGLD